MTTLLDEAIARLKALPEDRREAAAFGVLQYLEALQEEAEALLTPEELAEIDAQLAEPADDVPEAEMEAFIAARRAW